MKWNNLNIGKCPNEECEEILQETQRKVECKRCMFSMRMSKYLDLIKGKESDAYKKATRKYRDAKKYNEKKKIHQKEIDELYKKEREFNLMKMNRK